MFVRSWGSGAPVIALHPLALESTAFAGVARLLEQQGLRTLAADLPGFGRSEAGNEPLTAERLARPVIELARGLEEPPLVLGMSLGARVALEAALTEPAAFRGLALVVPYLPWVANRWALSFAHLLQPELAERVPLEILWPLLKRLSDRLDAQSSLEHDWLARASVRVAYYLSCPATRRHFISATREMMLDPAWGEDGIWTRLPDLAVPTAWLWTAQDRLIPHQHIEEVARRLPQARRLELACCGHFANGSHHRCFDEAMALTVRRVTEQASTNQEVPRTSVGAETCDCYATTGDALSVTQGEQQTHTGGNMRRLSGEDALFVYGESPGMPMHTLGTMILDPSTAEGRSFDYDSIVGTLAARLHLMPPYRQRLVEVPLGLARPVLADDPEFDIERHVQRVSVDTPGTLRELARVVGEFAGRPLDRAKPLWEMLYIDGVEGGRVALVTKMHHCMLDGASGASQMAGLLDLEPCPAEAPTPPTWRPAALPTRAGLFARALVPDVPSPMAVAALVAQSTVGFVRRTVVRRERSSTLDALASAVTPAPRIRSSGAITTNRSVAFASASLRDIKRVKKVFGVTVNDVVLAACALALRDYLRDDDDLPEAALHCAVPVSIKTDDEKQEFSNKVSTMTVCLPTHLDDPGGLLEAIHEEAEAAKREFVAGGGDTLMGWLDLAWPAAMGAVARVFSTSGVADWLPPWWNLIVSNMAGPPVPLYLAGARVEAIYPMGPIAPGTGLNITVLSNMDRVDVGLLACKETVPHLWRLAEGFEDAVKLLARAAERRAAA